MKKQQIERWVESFLNGAPTERPTISADSAYEQFLLNCATRLETAFNLFQKEDIFLGDFLIALRNYLLTFQTEINVQSLAVKNAAHKTLNL